MIMDEKLQFASLFPVPQSSTGIHAVGDVVDLSVAENSHVGETLDFVVTIYDAFTSATSAAKVAFELVTDVNSTIAEDNSVVPIVKLGFVPVSELLPGKKFSAQLAASTYKRYMGVRVHVSGEVLTGGRFSAFLTPEVSEWDSLAGLGLY